MGEHEYAITDKYNISWSNVASFRLDSKLIKKDYPEIYDSYVKLDVFKDKAIRSAHDCRRTYASIQYLHGIDIKTLQKQLGHAKTTQTWDYIKDIIDTETRAEKLEKGCIL